MLCHWESSSDYQFLAEKKQTVQSMAAGETPVKNIKAAIKLMEVSKQSETQKQAGKRHDEETSITSQVVQTCYFPIANY